MAQRSTSATNKKYFNDLAKKMFQVSNDRTAKEDRLKSEIEALELKISALKSKILKLSENQ